MGNFCSSQVTTSPPKAEARSANSFKTGATPTSDCDFLTATSM